MLAKCFSDRHSSTVVIYSKVLCSINRVNYSYQRNGSARVNIEDDRCDLLVKLKLHRDIYLVLNHLPRVSDGHLRISIVIPDQQIDADRASRRFKALLNINCQRNVP